MIRDRIVVGICDQSQSARLQMDAELTLEKAKTLVRQREAVQEQQIVLQTDQTPAKQLQPAQGKCSRCGRGPHPRQQCPAREAECHNCKKKGHYSAQCFHKSVAEVVTPMERMGGCPWV